MAMWWAGLDRFGHLAANEIRPKRELNFALAPGTAEMSQTLVTGATSRVQREDAATPLYALRQSI